MLDTYRRVESLDVIAVLSRGVFVQNHNKRGEMWSKVWPEYKSEETEAHGEDFLFCSKLTILL
jgi:hypothetical protein